MTTLPGQRFGRYELHGTLGHGGFATVYRAFDPALHREVALKALLPHLASEADLRRRFVAEAQALARLRHGNIVAVYDVGEADGLPFFTMELVEGETLGPRLAAGPMDLDSVLRVVAPLASALDYLHAAGIVHRDIKPGNIMLDRGGRPVLMDFGVARALDGTQHTATGATLGTPAYMAPEQVRGLAVSPATDIYALGILVYQMLSGRTPFAGDTAYMLHAQAFEPPPPLASLRPDLPATVCLAVEAALAKDPRRRPPTASALAADLAGAARPPLPPGWQPAPDPGVVAEDRTPGTIPAWPQPRRGAGGVPRAALIAGAAVLVLVAAGIGAFAASHGGHGPSAQPDATATSAGAPPAAASAPAPVATEAPPSATRTASPAASAAPPAPATPPPPPPTAPPPVAIEALSVDTSSVAGWADGRGSLQVPLSWRNARNDQLRLRIAPADNPTAPAVDDTPYVLRSPAGNASIAVAAPPSPLPAGINYLAQLYKVDGGDWSQLTSYEFSVPRRAAPPPPPAAATVAALSLGDIAVQGTGGSPRLMIQSVQPDSPTAPRAGEPFSFRVTVLNGGGNSGNSSITVSSPNARQLSSSFESCAIAGAQIDTNGPGQGVISVFSGDNAVRQPPAYWTTEVYFPSWTGGRSCTLHVTAQTGSPGALTLQIRATSKDPAGHVVNDPLPGSAGGTDQANLPVLIWNVPVGQ